VPSRSTTQLSQQGRSQLTSRLVAVGTESNMFSRASSFAGSFAPRNVTNQTFRYFRFVVTKVRDITQDPTYPVGMMQMTEFQLTFMGTRVDYTGATATNPSGANPSGQDASKAIDNSTSTVFLDWSGNGTVGSNVTGVIKSWVLQIDFGSRRTVDGFRYITGADVNGRDPVQWVLEGSNDNSAWSTIYVQSTDATITTSRTTATQIFYIGRGFNPYVAGLFRTKYSGYFNDVVSWFATATATSTVVQTTVIEDPNTDDGDLFSEQWLGYFVPSTTETYTFYLSSDDASYLWIGSNAVAGFSTANATVNNGGLHGAVETSGTASLTAGVYYPIRIQYGENTGGDYLTFNYSTATITKTTNVSGKVFYHPATRGF